MLRRSVIAALGSLCLAGAALESASTAQVATSGPAESVVSKGDHFEFYLQIIRAWKKHDIETVLSHLSDDIVWYEDIGQPPLRGKAAVRERLTQMAPERHSENWRIFNHAANGEKLFVEGVDDFTDAKDHRIAVPYAGIVEFKGGLIASWRDYVDTAMAEKMVEGGPVPDVIEPLLSRKGVP